MEIKLIVVGAGGRMGRRILSLAAESEQFHIVAAVERPGHPDIGKDAGIIAASQPIGVVLADTYPAAAADVVIDFSQAEAADKTVDYCLQNNIALVVGTTGLSDEHREKLHTAAGKIPVLYATNMSVGMNLLFSLAPKVASMLGTEYDIEIVEQHHERYDGKGYPYGIEGEKINLGARILALCDAFDAMTTDRPYRKALSLESAVSELKKCSGTQFDPKVVEAFLKVIERKPDITRI